MVLGCDDSAQKEFLNHRPFKSTKGAPVQSNSNLWFVDPGIQTSLDREELEMNHRIIAVVLIVLASGTYVLKAAGPLVLGDRTLPVAVQRWVDLLPAALLAALALVSTVGDGQSIVIDARVVGMIVAGLALVRRAPFVVVVVLAAAATALVRLLTG